MNHPFLKKIQTNSNLIKDESRKKDSHSNIELQNQKESISDESTNIEENYPIQSSSISSKEDLTSEEKLLMQLSLERQKACTFSIEKLTLLLQTKKLMIQNYELRIKQLNDELLIVSGQVKQDQSTLNKMKENHIKLTEELANKYALEPGWRFNSDTGEIM